MKRDRPLNTIPIALVAGLFCLFGSTEVSALTYEHSLSIPLSEISISTDTIAGEVRTLIRVTDGSEYVNKDTLLLPMKNLRFKVPLLAENFRVKSWNVNSSAPMSMNYPPVKYFPEPQHRHYENESTVEEDPYVDFDPTSISSDPVVLMGDYYLGAEEHYLNVGIHAAEYSGSKLTTNTSVSFIIEYSMRDNNSSSEHQLINGNSSIEAMDVPLQSTTFELQSGPVYPSGIIIRNYVILVPQTLESGVRRLRDWKRQRGYNVVVKTFESIYNDPTYASGSSPESFDRAAQVRHWLKNFYSSYGDTYCLIVGDHDTSAPVRKFRIIDHTTTSDPNDYAYTPSDIYFADLVTEWDFALDPSGIYSASMEHFPFSPTIAVGRLLCSSKKELENYTDKVIIYENYPGYGDDSYLSKGFLGQHKDALNEDPSKRSETEILNLPYFPITVIQEERADNVRDSRPDPASVLNEIESSGLVSLQYHATPFSFMICKGGKDLLSREIVSEERYKSILNSYYAEDQDNTLSSLNNKGKPNVIYSIACDIAPFDKLKSDLMGTIPKTYRSIASQLTSGNMNGAIALLGNTRPGRWDASTYLETEFMKLLSQGFSIGLAENYSKINFLFHPKFRNNEKQDVTYKHHVIGDPSITVWLGAPSHESPNINAVNTRLHLAGLSGEKSRYSLICGDYSFSDFMPSSSNVSINLNSEFTTALHTKLGYLMIMDPTRLPFHQLLTSGNKITDCNASLITRDLEFKKTSNFPSVQTDTYLWIGAGSDIKIHAMGKISSDEGILIEKDGKLEISADGSVLLEGDKVKSGGTLNVTGTEVTLGPGTIIENGATININCN